MFPDSETVLFEEKPWNVDYSVFWFFFLVLFFSVIPLMHVCIKQSRERVNNTV